MQQLLVYGDSLSWGIIPGTRRRLEFEARWPGVLERELAARGRPVRVIEDCLNGRRTVWEDPFKPGRNGLTLLPQRIEACSPLALVVLMLGTNDLQSMHPHTAWHAAQGVATLVGAIRRAPIEPGMPVPPVLVVAPPPAGTPRGSAVAKFVGADRKGETFGESYQAIAAELGCPFLDAGALIAPSETDGVHLDREQHLVLGRAVAEAAAPLLAAVQVSE
jgi:lysophospholipase L1-like esterase